MRLYTLGTLLGLLVALGPETVEAQYYCDGRQAITAQWGGCNGTEAVCSDLMVAVTQTWNWWSTVNNTNGSSLGLAVHNFFTTDAYGQLLSITNNNTAYPSVCTKIAKIVAQLLTWNASNDANVILGNGTYAATARQEMLSTVIPVWGYTIGQYIACGATCTNYSSTTSTTSTHTATSTSAPHTTSSTATPTTSASRVPTTSSTGAHSTSSTGAPSSGATGSSSSGAPGTSRSSVTGSSSSGAYSISSTSAAPTPSSPFVSSTGKSTAGTTTSPLGCS